MLDQQQSKQTTNQRLRSTIHFLQGIAFTLFLLSVFLIVYFIIIYNSRSALLQNYAIVFDAGSSHTEMYIYHWPADKSNGLGNTSSVNEFFVCPIKSVSIEENGEKLKLKAISDFENHLNRLGDYFRPCIDEAIRLIPSNRQKYSPIFLGATAGMRLVRMRNSESSTRILETIRDVFSQTPFEFVLARQVRILSGTEEAIDGWITTNLLLEKFRRKTNRASSMVGVLDLGGASTQVTFTCKEKILFFSHSSERPSTFSLRFALDDPQRLEEQIPDEFTASMNLFDENYKPFAHSFLCWGKNEAQKRHRARLIISFLSYFKNFTSTNSIILIRDPCLMPGANETLSFSQIFRSPCVIKEKEKLPHNLDASVFVFFGSGNANKCRKRITALFDTKKNDKSANCPYKSDYCTFDHSYQPKIPQNLDFIALSGYYYVVNNLAYGMTNSKSMSTEGYDFKDFSRAEFDQRMIDVCETNYSIFYEREGVTTNNEQHKRTLCFDASYVWLLLTYGIGFQESNLQRLSFAYTFPTGKVGWTLGYMINQTNYMPAEYRQRLISRQTFVGSFTGSMTIALITFLFLLVTVFFLWTRSNNLSENLEHQIHA